MARLEGVMSYLRAATILALSFTLYNPVLTMAAEPVGEAVLIKTEVTGASGPLVVNGPVHRDERIRTSQSGLGQFVFIDGTKLAVGWGSSVVIDKFVFDDSDSVKKLSIKAAKGTFRWISGNSKSSAYEILTPAGTIGVRGTAFDVNVGQDGTTAVVLLNGSAQFCGPGGCRELKQRCDCVVAKRNGDMTAVRRVDRGILRTLGSPRALPFLSGNQALSGRLGTVGIGCSFAKTSVETPGRSVAPGTRPSSPAPNQPDQQPDPPSTPSTPDQPSTPRAPDQPNTPNTPDKPHVDKGKEHHHHDKGHHDEDDDRDNEDGHNDRDHGRHHDGHNESGHHGRGDGQDH
jgi:hypothetical protein